MGQSRLQAILLYFTRYLVAVGELGWGIVSSADLTTTAVNTREEVPLEKCEGA